MTAVVGAVYELPLPLLPRQWNGTPVPPLSANDRFHWRKEAQLKRLVRHKAKTAAEHLGACGHLRVQLHYATGDNRGRRDPANLCATSKPAIDGLVDAGLVPDDNPEFVTELMPVIHLGADLPRRLWLELEVTA
ncbi:hypothetical protein Lesp02_70540 [Lentzea sp. NBRC 105346]|uniref:hypothetical protein n=1 Tax=Lentzea sp. NBRC 105346 TaxID=3032205 RepID=UPI0024A0821C|nr:hypothetical protein [Lentzea sp. NBRC 105346]GLZ34867.1 hypothetical protein Lesp02_70540 [Lentzea sp. NBRC 105346]